MERIRALLRLWSDRRLGNAEVRSVAAAHIADLETQQKKLDELVATLRHLVKSCHGEDRDHCPIIAELGGKMGSLSIKGRH
jgi:hypothetical protein